MMDTAKGDLSKLRSQVVPEATVRHQRRRGHVVAGTWCSAYARRRPMLYRGPLHGEGNVALVEADPDEIRLVDLAPDVVGSVAHWLGAAEARDDVVYFAIRASGDLVGQILLHDVDAHTGEALVAYHLFWPDVRGRGIGTAALALLQRWVRQHEVVRELVVITSADNLASRRAAEKCGFVADGTPREDPTGIVLRWRALDGVHHA